MTRQPWTQQQLDALRQLYPDYEAEVVASVLGRPRGSVHQKAAQLGIHKSEAFKAAYLLRQASRPGTKASPTRRAAAQKKPSSRRATSHTAPCP